MESFANDLVIPIHNADLSLISSDDREHYTLIVLTSTDERHGCELCHTVDTIVHRVAQAWFNDYPESNYLFFVNIDIVDRSNIGVFEFLNLQTVPQIWLVPPSKVSEPLKKERLSRANDPAFANYSILFEPHAEFEIPMTSLDDQIFQFADWLGVSIQKRILLRQENAVMKFVLTFLVTFSGIIFVKKKGPSAITSNVDKAKIYKWLLLAVLLAILGGYLFTTIQGVSFLAQNDKGEVIYISGGRHYQFGVEIVIVAAHYFLLGATLVILTYTGQYKVPGKLIQSEGMKAFFTILESAVLYLLYSSFTSIYLRKDGDYPYHFLQLF